MLVLLERKTAVVLKAKTQDFKSVYLGISWDKNGQAWRASITHSGKGHHLGQYDDEQEAGRAFDTAARRLRPNGEAHGGRNGTNWVRLNFATVEEEAYAAQQGMRDAGSTGSDPAVALAAKAQGFRSAFIGVSWPKRSRQWQVEIRHKKKNARSGSVRR